MQENPRIRANGTFRDSIALLKLEQYNSAFFFIGFSPKLQSHGEGNFCVIIKLFARYLTGGTIKQNVI